MNYCCICNGSVLGARPDTICHRCWNKACGSEPATVAELLRMYQRMWKTTYYLPPYLRQVVREYQLLGIESDPLGSLLEVEREV